MNYDQRLTNHLPPTTNDRPPARVRPTVVRHYTSKLMQASQSGVASPNTAIIQQAREALDRWVREVVAWHFDPATGSPFWLERARTLGWDPRERITGFADLKHFGGFEDEWLRGGPVQRWVPKGCAGKPVFVFETGGTTGVPKTRINCEDFRIDYEVFSTTFPDEHFPKGGNWLMLGPSGPQASAARRRASVPAPRRHLLLRGSRSPMGHQVDQEGMERALERLQGSRHRSGGDDPAGRTTTSSACSRRQSCWRRSPCVSSRWGPRSARSGSRASSPAARNSRRSGTASRMRSCSTAPT